MVIGLKRLFLAMRTMVNCERSGGGSQSASLDTVHEVLLDGMQQLFIFMIDNMK